MPQYTYPIDGCVFNTGDVPVEIAAQLLIIYENAHSVHSNVPIFVTAVWHIFLVNTDWDLICITTLERNH